MAPTFSPIAVEIIGLVAGCITTFCWIPQAAKIIRTRDTRALSLVMQSMVLVGTLLWLIYGVLIMSWPLILANIISFLLVSTIFTLKLRYG